MGTIMGMGSSHWPAMIQPDEAKPWPFLRTLANDPRVPAELKNPVNWPAGVRAEWGEDEGISAHREHRRRLVEAFRKLYGYTSDEKGIRHSLLEETASVAEEDARFMIVACSAFLNLLIVKADKANLLK